MSEHERAMAEPSCESEIARMTLNSARHPVPSERNTPDKCNIPKRKRPLALLSIDGCPHNSLGPISQISIVENVLSHYQFDCSEEGVSCVEEDNIEIGDIFDLVIGTGTGGLVACMLAVLKMTIKEAKTAYIQFYKSAFRPESRTKEERGKDLRRALENLLDCTDRSILNVGGKLSCIKMKDIEKKLACRCKFAVTAMISTNTSSPVLLRAYRGRNASVDCSLLEALLATLSDPSSFPSIEIENEEYISANIGYLNPSEDLLHEVSSIFRHDTIATIVSIGPGRPPPISVKDSGFSQAVHHHAGHCQATSERILARFSRYHDLCLRFEVDTLPASSQGNWGTVVGHSRIYMTRTATQDLFRILSDTLIHRPARLKVVDLSGLEPGALERIEHSVEQATNRVENVHDALQLRDLEVKWSASYNSADINHLYPRLCTADTRSRVINRIESWARDARHYSHTCICWVTGRPGTGKSTILRTMCKRLDEDTVLAESYFCSIQLPSKDSKHIFPAIALRLSSYFPSFRRHLIAKLQKEPSCAYAPLQEQFQELLCARWTEADLENLSLSPFVVVIDALDECEQGDEVISLLMDAVEKNELGGLKFLVSSRPMRVLLQRFRRLQYQRLLDLDDTDTTEVSQDIGRFLSESLDKRLQPNEITRLTSLTQGLFIFASTLVKYLLPSPEFPDRDMQRRYKTILEREETSLNALYDVILVEALSPESSGFKERLQVLHVISCVEEAASASVIADFIGVNILKILSVAKSLHAVLSVSWPDDPILVIHKSFYDFIVSRLDGPFKYNSSFHLELTLSCLTQMNALRFNICNIESSFAMDDNFEWSPVDIIGRTLEYACQHWWEHFQKCTQSDQQNIEDSIAQFLTEKGLFWIETMILLGNERQCRDALNGMASNLSCERTISEPTPGLLALEASKIVSRFMTISPKMTSHLYLSVLSLWEGDSVDCWKQQFHGLPRIISRCIDGARNCMVSMKVGSCVNSVAYSPDGNHIVSGSDKSVRIWDALSGHQLNTLNGCQNNVVSVAFSPDGNRIVSGSDDNSLRIWDAHSGRQLNMLNGHQGFVHSVAFSPDGSRIVSGSSDNSVRIWDAHSGHQLSKLSGHRDWVYSVAFSPDGTRIVSGSNDKSLRIWDAQSGLQVNKLNGHEGFVRSAAFSPDGSRIVSGSSDRSVCIWDADSGHQLSRLNGHRDWVRSVAFSPNSSRIVSSSNDNSVRIWDAQSGYQLSKLNGHQDRVYSAAFSPDGNRVVSGSRDGTVRIWDALPDHQLNKLNGHQGCVCSVAFSPDGSRIVSGSSDNSVRIWDAQSGYQLNKLNGHRDRVCSVAFSPDGTRVISGSRDKSVRIWDAHSGRQLSKLKGHRDRVCSTAFSPDGILIASGSFDSSVRIWDAQSGHQLSELNGHRNSVQSVAFSPDSTRIVSGSYDRSVRIWDAQSGHQLSKLNGHLDLVQSVAFSPDSTRIASGSYDGCVCIWDAQSGHQLNKLNGSQDLVYSVAFSPDGSRIVSVGNGMLIRDTLSGHQLSKVNGNRDLGYSVAFSPDGTRIVSGSNDNSVRIWDALAGYPSNNLNDHQKDYVDFSTIQFCTSSHQYPFATGQGTNYATAPPLPATHHHTDPTELSVLQLNPTSTSYHTRSDGWVVTSEEETGAEEKILWLPPSLRPFYPALLMEISESGFNGIDLSRCTFGHGWFNIFGGDPEQRDATTHSMRPIVDLKKRGLRSGNDEQRRTLFHAVKDSVSESTRKFRGRLTRVFD